MTMQSSLDSSHLPLMALAGQNGNNPKQEHREALADATRLSLAYERLNPSWDFTITRYRHAIRTVLNP